MTTILTLLAAALIAYAVVEIWRAADEWYDAHLAAPTFDAHVDDALALCDEPSDAVIFESILRERPDIGEAMLRAALADESQVAAWLNGGRL